MFITFIKIKNSFPLFFGLNCNLLVRALTHDYGYSTYTLSNNLKVLK